MSLSMECLPCQLIDTHELSAPLAGDQEEPSVTTTRNISILTTEEAAQALRLSGSSIRRLIKAGRLRAYRVAGVGTIRILREDVARLLVQMHGP